MRSAPFILTALVFVASCSHTDEQAIPSTKPALAVADVAKNYRQFKSMTKEPVAIDPGLAALCAPITDTKDRVQKKSGPHADTTVRIFMNDPAANAFQKSATYPVGSAVIKEKKSSGSWEHKDGVGGMIKRPPGFDPSHGDWEYFYFENPAKIEAGKIASCVQCHSSTAGTDYVFGTWAKEQNQ